jgi:hypothetical protein
MDEITERVGDEEPFRACPLPCPLLAAIRELTVVSDSELSEYSSSTYTSD